jgi:CRISPR system Cascade subunit CasB
MRGAVILPTRMMSKKWMRRRDMTEIDPLIQMLESMRDREDRAGLAQLRRGLGQTAATPEVSRIVQRVMSESTPPWRESACYVVAPLFALHPVAGGRGNLGDHVRALAPTGEPPPNVERRFVGLLACDGEELPDALRQAVMLLKSNGVPVAWDRLLKDVQAWEHPDRYVQRNWSRSFWRMRIDHASQSEVETIKTT